MLPSSAISLAISLSLIRLKILVMIPTEPLAPSIIKFEPLSEYTTDDDLVDYMQNHSCGTFLIYMRYRYDYEVKWTYSTEICYLKDFSNIEWLDDWYEGQENFEYLGIAEIS